jgi:hypothetical protein
MERRIAELERRVEALTKLVDELRGKGKPAGAPKTKAPAADPVPRDEFPGTPDTLPTPRNATQGPSPGDRATTQVLRTYPLRVAEGTEVVRALEKVFEGKGLRASAIADNKAVLIYGAPADLPLVETVLKTIEEAAAIAKAEADAVRRGRSETPGKP